MENKTEHLMRLLTEAYEELDGAGDYYGEGPYPVDEELMSKIRSALNNGDGELL